ncbi:MAG: hypothetical protein HYX57_05440 [Chloroflexi bacterium]|nr:hypothetical protein [Chloroflexota bacterium]
MATTTPGPAPESTEHPREHAPSSAAAADEAERYLADRLGRWLAGVAMASATAPTDDELDDAA